MDRINTYSQRTIFPLPRRLARGLGRPAPRRRPGKLLGPDATSGPGPSGKGLRRRKPAESVREMAGERRTDATTDESARSGPRNVFRHAWPIT